MAKQQIKTHQALSAIQAIRSLDPVFINDGQKVEKAQSFDFSASVIWDLSENLSALQPIAENLEKTRGSLVRKYGVAGLTDTTLANASPSLKESYINFQAEMQDILDKEIDVDIVPIRKDDLELKKNKIPVSVLTSLKACNIIIA